MRQQFPFISGSMYALRSHFVFGDTLGVWIFYPFATSFHFISLHQAGLMHPESTNRSAASCPYLDYPWKLQRKQRTYSIIQCRTIVSLGWTSTGFGYKDQAAYQTNSFFLFLLFVFNFLDFCIFSCFFFKQFSSFWYNSRGGIAWPMLHDIY